MKKILLIVLILTGVVLGVIFRSNIDMLLVKQYVQAAGWMAPLVFIFVYICFTVLMLPGSILTILGGVLFGYWGILINLVAATLGATMAFAISRYVSQDWVREHIIHDDSTKVKQKINVLLASVNKNGWQLVAVLRLIPLVPFNLLNYILGLTTISLGVYCVTSAVFMLPGSFAYTYLGILGELALQGDSQKFVSGLLYAISIFVVLLILIKAVKHWRKKDLDKLKLDF